MNYYLKWLLKSILALLILLSLMRMDCCAQEFLFKGNRKKDRIGFRLIKNLIVIQVYLNNKGPYNFILDSGVGSMLITDPSILDSSQLTKLRKVKVGGAGNGEDLDAYISIVLETKIGHSVLTYTPSVVLEEDFFSLTNYLGIPIHGLIGSYFFNSFVVKIKYSTQSIVFYDRSVHFKKKGFAIPVEMIFNKPYLNLTLQTENMSPMMARLLMDTGASHSLSLEIFEGKKFPLPEHFIPANLGVGFGGPVTGNIARAPLLKIGPYEIKNTLVAYPDYEGGPVKALATGRTGILGADILSRFDLTMDYENRMFYFKPNQSLKRPFEHDMSGLEIYQTGSDLDVFIVARVEPDSPAEQAGIFVGDQLLGLNLMPANDLKMQDIDQELRSGDGRKCILKLARDGKILFKIITLKKRI